MENPQKIGSWRVVRRLGAGGMGTVFEVVGEQGETRALKLLNAQEDQATRRFLREYRALARLRHPNVVTVYDSGQFDRRPFFTMDLVEGQPLNDWLRGSASQDEDEITAVDSVDWSLVGAALPSIVPSANPLDPDGLRPLSPAQMGVINRPSRLRRVRESLTQILQALAYVHEQRIVHRDLKSSNVLVDRSGHIVLMDFGVATDDSAENPAADAGQVMGTYAYMSPEQVRGQEVDLRSDLYSLGVLLFEALAGRRPFEADSPAAAIYQHVFSPVPDLHMVNSDAPKDLVRLAHLLLGKSPGDRPASAWEILEGLGEEVPSPRLRTVSIFQAGMVGRDQQMGRFSSWLARPGQGLVCLSGGPGVGKTRFLMEALDVGREQGYRGVFLAGNSDRPYGFVQPLLDLVYEGVEGNPLVARRLLRDDGSLLLRLDPRLGQIENFQVDPVPPLDSEAERMRVSGAFWRVLRRMARQEPVAIHIDNWNQADELSTELLYHVLGQLSSADDVLLAFLTVGGVRKRLEPYISLDLKLLPLDEEQVGILVAEILGNPGSSGLASYLHHQAKGSPLLVRELLRRLADQRLLDKNEDGFWVLPEGELGESTLQSQANLYEMAANDLEALENDSRELLLAVAVLDSRCSWDFLQRILDWPESRLQAEADPLLKREILSEREDLLDYRFQAYRALVLESGGEEKVQALHRQAAELLYTAEHPDPEGMVGHALAGGHEELLDSFLPAAARKARGLGDLARAQRHYDRILERYRSSETEVPVEFILERASVFRDRGDLPAALRAVDEFLPAGALEGTGYGRLLAERLEILGDLGDGDACLAALPNLDACIQSAGDADLLFLIKAKAGALQRFGDAELSLEAYKLLAEEAEKGGDRRLLARAIQAQGICKERLGELQASAALLRQAIDLAREVGDEQVLLIALINAVPTVLLSGHLEDAAELGQEALTLARRLSNVRAAAIVEANSFWVRMELGDWDGLEADIQERIASLDQDGAPYAEPECRLLLARVLLAQGEKRQAMHQAELGIDRAQSLHLHREGLILEILLERIRSTERASGALVERYAELRAQAKFDQALGVVAWSWEQEGLSHRDRGDDALAASCFKQGLTLARQMGYELFARRCEEALKA